MGEKHNTSTFPIMDFLPQSSSRSFPAVGNIEIDDSKHCKSKGNVFSVFLLQKPKKTMLSFIKKSIATIWANHHVAKAQKQHQHAEAHQEELLLALVQKAQKTLFGRERNFDEIHSIQDFQQRVSIQDYEDLKPYIDRIRRGQAHILFPETPTYFAKTSGTTSGAKYIPLTQEGIDHQVKAAQSAIFHYISRKGNANFVNGKMIFLQGNPQLEEQFGIKTGRLSGIVAHHVPSYLQKNRLPSWETNTIEDWETKVDAIVQETEHENMTLISGIPPWLIMYFEKLQERHHKPVAEIFPNLQLIITGGVNYEPYREKMNALLGKEIDTVQTFPASEGFFAFQDDYTQNGLQLLTHHGIFYEFIPLSEIHSDTPTRLTLREVELHKDYALILTTDSGLWAYSIGDVVQFVSKNPYKIIVTGRTKHFTSAFGEHVIGHEVETAMKMAQEKLPTPIREFHLAPQVNPTEGLPYHEWLIEFDELPQHVEEFAQILDTEMRKQNTYYNDLISGNVLRPLQITPLKKNAFIEYAKTTGKLGGQNKIPRLANDRSMADELIRYKK